jgi:hypothetical protein
MRVAAEIVGGEEALLYRYIVTREDLEGFSIPQQNELVSEHIETLRHVLSTRKRRAPEPTSGDNAPGFSQPPPPAAYPQQSTAAYPPQQPPPAAYPGPPQQAPAACPQQPWQAAYPPQQAPAACPQQPWPAPYPPYQAPAAYWPAGLQRAGYPRQQPWAASAAQQSPPYGYHFCQADSGSIQFLR